MIVYPVSEERAEEAGDVLARSMFDDPTSVFIVPDHGERLEMHRMLFTELVRDRSSSGLVEACGEPMAGVALWVRQGAIDEAPPSEPSRHRSPAMQAALDRLGPEGSARAGALNDCLAELRRRVAPEPHLYLNLLGVAPERQGEGVGGRLLESGNARADREGVPSTLDTLTDSNIAFYERRGYRVVTTALIEGSAIRVTAMRRAPAGLGTAGAAHGRHE